jgi:hypothetical protein
VVYGLAHPHYVPCGNGRIEEAQRLAAQYVTAFPGFRVSTWIARAPINNPGLVEEWAESYRRAGLPE